jgi:hypothetical protein
MKQRPDSLHPEQSSWRIIHQPLLEHNGCWEDKSLYDRKSEGLRSNYIAV